MMSCLNAWLMALRSHSSQPQLPGFKRLAVWLHRQAVHARFSTILILLSFLTFVAASSPHRVHHLGDSGPPSQLLTQHHDESHDHDHQHDHPVPDDRPAPHPHDGQPQPLSECVVLSLLQSSLILGAEPALLSVPLAPQPLESLTPWCCPLDVHANSTRTRAPPMKNPVLRWGQN